MRELTVGILETGPVAESLAARHGDYPAMFRRLLAGRGFAFRTWSAMKNILPDSVDACDGWIVTGSRHGAYEDHDWIPPLEGFLRRTHARKTPLVGVCFGHQIIAQALGGRVVKFPGGWWLGRAAYALEGFARPARLIGVHQDQVIEAPKGARVVGRSDFCAVAALDYGPHAWSLQPHPEFSAEFFIDLARHREDAFPARKVASALKTIREPCDGRLAADKIEAVLKSRPRRDPRAE